MSLSISLKNVCDSFVKKFDEIPAGRKEQLQQLADYISKKYNEKETPRLIVICTHNSRRSHIGQLWLAVGAEYFDLPLIETYSGGTEATAFNPRSVSALKRIGFDISTNNADAQNPKYQVRWSEAMDAYTAFSKKFDDEPNPTSSFGAIMVCTEADEGCPFVPGCDFRLSLPYDDPKAFDDSDLEVAKYDERVLQIGREIIYTMHLVAKA
ncbi:MAG: hypothetical protein ACWA5P_06750 [bacterium]